MKHRERVKKAFHFECPDRVPISSLNLNSDFFPVSIYPPKSWQPLTHPPHVQGGVNSISKWFYRTFVYNWKKKFRKKAEYPKKWWKVPHMSMDEWGILWKSSGSESDDITRGHPSHGPLQESWENLDAFKIPDISNPKRYRIVKSWFWKFLGRNRYCIGELVPNGFFNLCSQLRGFSNFLVDLSRNRNNVVELIEKLVPYYKDLIGNYKKYYPKLDAIICADDLGTQKSPFISPQLFKKYFKEPYKEIIKFTHDLNLDFILHSCGQILELIPDLIEIGVDVFEFDSPHMTGVENFKIYAKEQKVAFWLSSNIQSTYVNGTPKDVMEEIKYYIKEIANNKGGLAIYEYMSNRALGTPKENIIAQRESTERWGNYKNCKIDWVN
jgi:uroporphyrinogen decarboxylase